MIADARLCRWNHTFRLILTAAIMGGAMPGTPARSVSAEVPDSYRDMWNDPVVAKRIDEGIEQNRKGNALLEVVDKAGKPVPGAVLDIRQTTHEFLFGCNVLVLGQLGEKNERYEREFARLFNFATTTFCCTKTSATWSTAR